MEEKIQPKRVHNIFNPKKRIQSKKDRLTGQKCQYIDICKVV